MPVDYIRITCPQCASHLRVRSQYIGHQIKCRTCETSFQVPELVEQPCPACQSLLRYRADHLGRRVICRHCGVGFVADLSRSAPSLQAEASDPVTIIEALRAELRERTEQFASALRELRRLQEAAGGSGGSTENVSQGMGESAEPGSPGDGPLDPGFRVTSDVATLGSLGGEEPIRDVSEIDRLRAESAATTDVDRPRPRLGVARTWTVEPTAEPMAQLQRALDDTRAEVDTLREQLNRSGSRLEYAESELRLAREAHEATQIELTRVRDQEADHRAEFSSLIDQLAAMRVEFDQVREALAQAEQATEALRDERDALIAERDQLQRTVDATAASLASLQGEISGHIEERDRLQERLNQLGRDSEAIEQRLRSEIAQLQERLGEDQREREAISARIGHLERELIQERSERQAERATLEAERNALRTAWEAAEVQLTTLRLMQPAAQPSGPSPQLEAALARIDELNSELLASRGLNDELRRFLADLGINPTEGY
jgi:DNA-directed RNA polymerase subunit M/transcription elongation factor TFIIS/predicted  nucleic acid-binding Zn-ribbon protein